MTYSVYNHWDTLKNCIVGRTYPPEFYSWIKDTNTRQRFEKLSEETEEDYQALINLLTKFGVSVQRPGFPEDLNELWLQDKWVQPPTAPRDYFLMIHDKFWVPNVPNFHHAQHLFERKHGELAGAEREQAWKEFQIADQLHLDKKLSFYTHIFDEIKQSGTEIKYTDQDYINGCFVSRLGDRLYFATQSAHDSEEEILKTVDKLFPNTHNKVVPAEGHGDAVYCPVTEGLIISINDMPTYAESFPDWEVVYLPDSNFAYNDKFKVAMTKNKGRWFVPGFEKDPNMMHMVDHYFDEWVGQASETQFQVNILIIDPKNIVVSSHNDQVEKACAKYGIEVHVVPFRHKYFWDAGTHCITNDINRVK
jgi:N-dimethylarginine dimethylaminohydrolase